MESDRTQKAFHTLMGRTFNNRQYQVVILSKDTKSEDGELRDKSTGNRLIVTPASVTTSSAIPFVNKTLAVEIDMI